MIKIKTALSCQLFVIVFLGFNASAADVWFYDWREPPTQQTAIQEHSSLNAPQEKHWIVTEFGDDPFPGQLQLVAAQNGFQKASLLFKRSVAPALADDYVALVREWKTRGVETHLKFIGTLPTEMEARILKPVCELGARIFFITNSLPTEYEAANLMTLKGCVQVDLVLNRYLRYKDVADLKKIPGIPLTMTNDYFPAYPHVDNFNLIDNPVALRVQNTMPVSDQIALLNLISRLTSLTLDLDMVPMENQYGLLANLKRSPDRKLSLRWGYSEPRTADLDAWEALRLDRIQVKHDVFRKIEIERRMRALPSEIIVETFALLAMRAVIGGVDGLEARALNPF